MARRITEALQSHGVKVWLDEAEMGVGDSLTNKIAEGLENSDFVVAMLSSNSTKSKWVRKELEIAYNREIQDSVVHILPIVLDDCEIPTFLVGKIYADFRTSFPEGISALLRKLSDGRRIDTPHHPIIRSYEVPISSSSGDQSLSLQQNKTSIFIQWSELRGTRHEIYIHKIAKKSLVTLEAIGFELPGEPWGGFIRAHKGRMYSIAVCEIEYDKVYQIWLFDIESLDSQPEMIGEISNPYIDDVAIIGEDIVIVGLFCEALIIDILSRNKNTRSHSVSAPESQGVASIFTDGERHHITYITSSDVRYHEFSKSMEPCSAKVRFKLNREFENEILIYPNCIFEDSNNLSILAGSKSNNTSKFDLIEFSGKTLRQKPIEFFENSAKFASAFKHSHSSSDETVIVSWNSHEGNLRNAILNVMLFDRQTLKPLWEYERTLTSLSNYASGVPIIYDNDTVFLVYIEEAHGNFKIKMSEIDISIPKKLRFNVKRWI
jgi:hypothetical protein